MAPKRDFADLTSDAAVQRRLAELYGDIDNLEWYVGIFAEDHPEDQMMGELLTAMVGYDAFTQALTNPAARTAGLQRGDLHPGRAEDHPEDAARCSRSSPATPPIPRRPYCRFTYGPERSAAAG